MVFEFLKKKFHDLTTSAVSPGTDGHSVADDSYEERRAEAEALHEKGETARAVELLESLAAQLAGEGSFPLAVAVRHQISSWTAGPPVAETAAEDAAAMARQHEATGSLKVQPKGEPRGRSFPRGSGPHGFSPT